MNMSVRITRSEKKHILLLIYDRKNLVDDLFYASFSKDDGDYEAKCQQCM